MTCHNSALAFGFFRRMTILIVRRAEEAVIVSYFLYPKDDLVALISSPKFFWARISALPAFQWKGFATVFLTEVQAIVREFAIPSSSFEITASTSSTKLDILINQVHTV